MKDIKYQEQTRQSTFAQNSITAPDESSKILAAAKDQVNRMEKNRQDDLAYKQQYLSTLKENAWTERKNRAENLNWQKDLDNIYLKALEQRNKAEQNKIKLQAQEQQDLYKDLANFSKTALQGLQAVDQKMAEEAKGMGNYLAAIGGLPPDSVVFMNQADRMSGAGQTLMNNLTHKLRANGVDEQTISSIKNMSGRVRKQAFIYSLSTAGNQYNLVLAENMGTPIHMDGIGETTLAEILQGKGTVEQLKHAHAQILSGKFLDFEKSLGLKGMNPALVGQHFLPGVRRAEQAQIAQFITAKNDALAIHNVENRRKETLGVLLGNGGFNDANSGQRFVNLVEERAGGDTLYIPQAVKETFADTLASVQSGEIPMISVYKLGLSVVEIPGQGKKLFKDHYPFQYKTLITEARTRSAKEEAQENITYKTFNDLMVENVLNSKEALNRNLNHEEIAATKQAYLDKGYDIPAWLEAEGVAEVLNDNAGKNLLESKLRNRTLTRAELYSGKYSETLITEYKDKVVDGKAAANKDIVEGQRSGIKAAIAKVGGQLAINPSHRNYEITALTGIALADLEKRVATAMKFGDYSNVDKAYQAEGYKLSKEIENGEGIYALRKQSDGKTIDLKGGFAYFDSPENFSIERKTKDMVKAVRDDGNVIHQAEFYPKELIEQTDNIIRDQQVPVWAIQIAKNYKKLNAYDIINRGRDLHGLKPIAVPGYPNAHPMYITNLEHKSSLFKSVQAMAHTNALYQSDAKPFSHGLDWMKDASAAFGGADTVTVGNIGSSNITTGTQAFGQNVEEMTVGNVLQLMSEGRLIKAGAYASTSKQINNLIDARQIDVNDLFNEETQDKLGIQTLWNTVGNFQTNAGDLIEGVGQANAYARGTDGILDDLERLGGLRAILKDLEPYLKDTGINPYFLKPSIIHRIKQLEALTVNG